MMKLCHTFTPYFLCSAVSWSGKFKRAQYSRYTVSVPEIKCCIRLANIDPGSICKQNDDFILSNLDVYEGGNNIILFLHSYYFYSFIYYRVVEGLDDYCLDFVKLSILILLGICAIQNELNKPDLALGTNEVHFQLHVGDMHVNR